MANAKLDKVNAAIAKVTERLAEEQSKLRALEREKTELENKAIVALFRRENLDEDTFSAILKERAKANGTVQSVQSKEEIADEV